MGDDANIKPTFFVSMYSSVMDSDGENAEAYVQDNPAHAGRRLAVVI